MHNSLIVSYATSNAVLKLGTFLNLARWPGEYSLRELGLNGLDIDQPTFLAEEAAADLNMIRVS